MWTEPSTKFLQEIYQNDNNCVFRWQIRCEFLFCFLFFQACNYIFYHSCNWKKINVDLISFLPKICFSPASPQLWVSSQVLWVLCSGVLNFVILFSFYLSYSNYPQVQWNLLQQQILSITTLCPNPSSQPL